MDSKSELQAQHVSGLIEAASSSAHSSTNLWDHMVQQDGQHPSFAPAMQSATKHPVDWR